jgi:hypothetical protein
MTDTMLEPGRSEHTAVAARATIRCRRSVAACRRAAARKPAETLPGSDPFAASAGNLQQIVAVSGSNPGLFRFCNSKSGAKSNKCATHLRQRPRGLHGLANGEAPARVAREGATDQDQVIDIACFAVQEQRKTAGRGRIGNDVRHLTGVSETTRTQI